MKATPRTVRGTAYIRCQWREAMNINAELLRRNPDAKLRDYGLGFAFQIRNSGPYYTAPDIATAITTIEQGHRIHGGE